MNFVSAILGEWCVLFTGLTPVKSQSSTLCLLCMKKTCQFVSVGCETLQDVSAMMPSPTVLKKNQPKSQDFIIYNNPSVQPRAFLQDLLLPKEADMFSHDKCFIYKLCNCYVCWFYSHSVPKRTEGEAGREEMEGHRVMKAMKPALVFNANSGAH